MLIGQEDRVYTLFINLRKAFDIVDHKMLIEKVIMVFTIFLIFLISNLANCQQLVTLNNLKYFQLKVLCGIPQNYTFGPLLFLIYISVLHKAFVNLNILTLQNIPVMPTHPHRAGVTHILKSSPACHKSCVFKRISILQADGSKIYETAVAK